MGRPRKNAKPQFIAALDYHMKLRGWEVEDLAKILGCLGLRCITESMIQRHFAMMNCKRLQNYSKCR